MVMKWIGRLFRHLCCGRLQRNRLFSAELLQAVEAEVARSERGHGGQICVAIEDNLPPGDLWREVSPRQRAIEVFSELRVWDTAQNNGVLLYVLVADQAVEIVADRALADQSLVLEAICHELERQFGGGAYREGMLSGIGQIGELLAKRFPPGEGVNEVPDRPVLL